MKKILTVAMLLVGMLFLVACESGITISFETNGGNEIADVKLTLELDLYDLEEPAKTGYTFAGWYIDETLENEFDPEIVITDNVTLYAKWDPIVFTVSISIDGVVSTQEVNYDEDAILPADPTKEGYTFTGWSSEGKNIKSDLTITASFLINAYTITFVVDGEELFTRNVNHGGTLGAELIPVVPEVTGKNGAWDQTDFTNMTSDMTVTAVYTDKVYTVNYVNKDGETLLGDASFGPSQVTHGSVLSAPNVPDSITGYDFVGFDYDFNDPITGDLTIVANYTKKSYTVTFRGLDGMVLETVSVLFGNDATAPSYSAPAGYTLGGWDIAFTDVSSNLTVNMILDPIEYTITFVTGEGSEVSPITAEYLSTITAPVDPTLTDMVFQGWFENVEGTGTKFIFTSSTTMPLNGLTLYAKWAHYPEYTVTVNQYLTTSSGTVLNNPIVVQMPYSTQYKPYETITGYDFVKYSINGEDVTDQNETVTIDGTTSINVYYQIETFTISFVTGEGSPIDPIVAEYNSLITAPASPTLTDMKFIGWYYNSEGTGSSYNFTSATTMPLNGLTLYAKWDYLGSYELTVSHSYTKNSGVVVTTPQVLQMDLNEVYIPHTEEIVGYTFVKYTVDGVDYTEINGEIIVNSTMTVVVYYQINTYTITFNTGEGSLIDPITQEYDSLIAIPSNPTLYDRVFKGWYDNPEFTGSAYIFNSQSKMPVGGLTLYAKWDYQTTYNVTIINVLHSMSGEETQNPTVLYLPFNSFYSPNVDINHYIFSHYVIDDITYTEVESSVQVNRTMTIYVHYDIETFTITFTQNPTGTLKEDTIFVVDYNASFTQIPALKPVAGFDVMWDREVFNNVRSNIVVGALYFSNTLKRVVFMDGAIIKYIAVQEDAADTDIISNTSALMNLSKPGYVFVGWYDSLSYTNLIDFDTFKYNSFEGISTTLYAKWESLVQLATPVVTDVTDTTITWYVNEVNALYPTSFKLLLDGVESIITPLTSVQSGTITTYTYVAETLANAGTHTIKIMSLGVTGTSMSSPYSVTFTHVTEADPVEVVDETLIYDYFLIEKAGEVSTYIFYTDMVYNFDAKYTFTITEGGSLISANANKLTTNATPGHFSFDVLNSVTDETKHYQGEVVTYISQFALGTNLNNYISSIDPENELFLSDTVTPYLVGSMNDFHFDLRILNSKGTRVEPTQTDLIYKFYRWNGVSYSPLTNDLSTFLSISEDYSIDFKTAAEGEKFKVEIDPKYEATKVQSDTVSFEFVVNNGYNVFTDADLKTYFADFNVQTINIHSTIEATLAPNQINEDGSPVNGYAEPFRTGASNGKIYANPYIRMSGAIDNDNLIVNGNYFTINGSNLPYMNVGSDPDNGFTDTGFDGSFDVVSVQVAILYYNVSNLSTPGINNNNVAFNNLTLVGNTSTPSINYSQSAEEILLAEQLMSRNSGGYVGITIRNGNSHIYNSNIGLMTIGVTTNAYGYTTGGDIVTTHIDHSTFYNEWANSIFGWASSQITITASDIGLSGGAAIHVEDNRPGSGGAEDPTVNLDNLTTVNNWVSGQEAWFKAYGMTSAALQIKGMTDQGIAALNKSIIRLIENPVTGLETEMFNFVLLTKTLDGASTDPDNNGVNDTGSEFLLNIPNASGTPVAVDQAFNFLSSGDPRIMGGNFAFAINGLLDTNTFLTAVGYMMATYSLPQAAAANLVYMAAFHNVTPDQVYNLYGAMLTYGLTWQQAYQAVGLTGQAPDEGRYMEISAEVPGLGPVIMITEYFAKTAE